MLLVKYAVFQSCIAIKQWLVQAQYFLFVSRMLVLHKKKNFFLETLLSTKERDYIWTFSS